MGIFSTLSDRRINQQPIAMTDPLGVTGWKYDANGLMTEQIDANGSRLGYAYDAAQQLTALTMVWRWGC